MSGINSRKDIAEVSKYQLMKDKAIEAICNELQKDIKTETKWVNTQYNIYYNKYLESQEGGCGGAENICTEKWPKVF